MLNGKWDIFPKCVCSCFLFSLLIGYVIIKTNSNMSLQNKWKCLDLILREYNFDIFLLNSFKKAYSWQIIHNKRREWPWWDYINRILPFYQSNFFILFLFTSMFTGTIQHMNIYVILTLITGENYLDYFIMVVSSL